VKEKEYFTNRKSLVKYLKNTEFNNAVILVKGSRGMAMEEFVNVLVSRGI
jgi:UDP-N-acetylmuramyl pentapeptide synthase